MLLAKSVFGADSPWVEFPLLLGGVSIIASIIGTYFVKLGAKQYIMGALYKGLAVSGVLAAIAFYAVTVWFMGGLGDKTGGFTPMSIFGTALDRPGPDRPHRLDHGELHRRSVPARDKRSPRPA